jgi:invasion protein IalB
MGHEPNCSPGGSVSNGRFAAVIGIEKCARGIQSKICIKTSANGALGMLMTDKMRSGLIVSASTIAGAILFAAIISGGLAPAAESPARAPSTAFEMQQLIYSPWVKFCGKGNDVGAKEVCFTGKDARTEAGQPVVAAALIEPQGEPKKLFRVTLPSPLQTQYGARIIIDKDPAISGALFTCFANGCVADYEATPELVGKLKKGQMLVIQAINLQATAISFRLPLVDNSGNSFAGAYEGPPTDPKVWEEQQKKQEKRWRF